MPCEIKNPANYDLSSLESHIHGMYDHFDSKYGFQKPPVMVFDTDPGNEPNVLGKTAYYDPEALEIHVFTDGRHSKDILRSIAHELIHHRQNLEGRLDVDGYSGPGYYLENDKLREVEHEAMLDGNATLREYEDTIKFRENKDMSLKEWKNNELNKLMLKKFGLLTEEKKPDFLDLDKDGDTEEPMSDAAEDAKEMNEEADLEEGGAASRTGNENHDAGKNRMTPDRIHEEDEDEMEEGRVGPRTTNADRFVGHEDRYQADRIHENKVKSLKESLRKIANAKNIFLKNKRIK